jgi:hypothetical protein
MKAHVNTLGAKSYWTQFDDTPDFVVMFVPANISRRRARSGSRTPGLCVRAQGAARNPTNLIAIARTVAAVAWRQEKLAGQAREIAALGKELYARMSVRMGSHIMRRAKPRSCDGCLQRLVGSLSQVLTQAKGFEALDVETGDREIPALPVAEQAARPLAKLIARRRQRRRSDRAGVPPSVRRRPLFCVPSLGKPRLTGPRISAKKAKLPASCRILDTPFRRHQRPRCQRGHRSHSCPKAIAAGAAA